MSLLDEAYENEMNEAAAAPESFGEAAEDMGGGFRFQAPDLSFLAAPTGEGAVEEYMQHPLNFDGKRSTARILRGCTGLCGSLDYALIDIALGVIEKIQEKKKPTEEDMKKWGNLDAY